MLHGGPICDALARQPGALREALRGTAGPAMGGSKSIFLSSFLQKLPENPSVMTWQFWHHPDIPMLFTQGIILCPML